MKITDVRIVPVWCPRRRAYGDVTRTALGPAAVSDYAIVFVDTDAGITGLGEVCSVFKRRGAVLRKDVELALVPAVTGEDPFRIAHLVQRMDRALDGVEEGKAAIEMALWDIVGKALGTPVYNLLGGKVRERVPLSYSIPFGKPGQMAELAQERVRAGHKTIKVKVGSEDATGRYRGRARGPRGDRAGDQAARRWQHGLADREACHPDDPDHGAMEP